MTKCPECEAEAPEKQIENLGMCERCYLKDKETNKTTPDRKNYDPDNNVIDEWRQKTTNL